MHVTQMLTGIIADYERFASVYRLLSLEIHSHAHLHTHSCTPTNSPPPSLSLSLSLALSLFPPLTHSLPSPPPLLSLSPSLPASSPPPPLPQRTVFTSFRSVKASTICSHLFACPNISLRRRQSEFCQLTLLHTGRVVFLSR